MSENSVNLVLAHRISLVSRNSSGVAWYNSIRADIAFPMPKDDERHALDPHPIAPAVIHSFIDLID